MKKLQKNCVGYLRIYKLGRGGIGVIFKYIFFLLALQIPSPYELIKYYICCPQGNGKIIHLFFILGVDNVISMIYLEDILINKGNKYHDTTSTRQYNVR